MADLDRDDEEPKAVKSNNAGMPEIVARSVLKDCAGMTWDKDTASITMTPVSFILCVQAVIYRTANKVRASLSDPAPVSLKPETKAGIEVVREALEAAKRRFELLHLSLGSEKETNGVRPSTAIMELEKALTALYSIEAGD
jgi:hypothetical protein